MNFNDVNEQKKRSSKRWKLIAFGLLFLVPPLGVGVFIANALDILPNIGGNLDVRRALAELQDLGRPRTVQPEAQPPFQPAQNRVAGMPNGGTAIAVTGVVTAAASAMVGAGGLMNFFDGKGVSSLILAIFMFCITAGGAAAAIFGSLRRKKKKRFEAYLKLIGDRTVVPIHYLADVMGIDYHKVIKDLQEMISRGILQPAWLDLQTYRLMRTEYSEDQVIQPEEKKEEAISRNDRILRQIRADNDLIADEEVSRKIDRIEDLTRKIFAILDERPEKEEQLYNFMNYYLPTTLKALESYARLEAQGIETAAIKQAKHKINLALDELADGYERQLDKLFEDDVVDITADIDVMRKMLHKDGLQADEIVAATAKKKQ